MKRARSSYEAVSFPTSEYRSQDPASQSYNTPDAEPNYSAFIEDPSGATDNSGLLQDFLGFHGEPIDVQANTRNQVYIASSNIDDQRNHFHTSQSPPPFSGSVLHGFNNYAEHAGASHQTNSAQQHFLGTADSPYSTRRRSFSVTSQPSTITPMANQPFLPAATSEAHTTPYSPYRGLFPTSDGARDHRHMSTRFGRQPYIHPEDDPTITEVEYGRDHQVGRIYEAMIHAERAQDNPGSIAMKRWVHGAHYKSDLVESFAHKVFDCLLVQVKEGFRGWHHNDYVDDDRKGEKEDREADCMSRLENIIDALEREKTICEDVVNSASQIRMFVNAPIAYAARKYQNRLGNSKRGRTKDASEPVARPTKVRRTGRQNREHSTPASDLPMSRDNTPQFQTPATTATPYYATPSSPQFQPSSTSTHLSPRQPLHPRPTMGTVHRHATATALPMPVQPNPLSSAISPPAMSPPLRHISDTYNPHRTPMPPAQLLPTHFSPAPPSTNPYHPAPPSPDDAKYPFPDAWPSTFDTPPIDPSLAYDLLPSPHPFTPAGLDPLATNVSVRLDEGGATHVSLADIEHGSGRGMGGAGGFGITGGLGDVSGLGDVGNFESFWNEQLGVQPFSFDGGAGQGFGS